MADENATSGRVSRAEFKQLPLSDSFMFGEVMRNPDICKLFLEELIGKPIERIEFITKEDTISDTVLYHGIRLDVFVKGSSEMYNAEMFGKRYKNYKPLLKRGRFYESMMDRRSLESGKDYEELPDSYIIFVCNFDFFDTGLAVCKRKQCIDGREDILFEDGSHMYVLNSHYTEGNASPAILEYLDFIRNNDVDSVYQSTLMEKVCTAVKLVRNDPKKEERFMVLENLLRDREREGREQGIEQGMKQGIEQGTATMLQNLMKSSGYSLQEAMRMLLLPESDYQKYQKLLAEQ